MSVRELSHTLNLTPSACHKLIKRGMPTSSAEAAQAWRREHAPPRAKRGQAGQPPPAPRPTPTRATSATPEQAPANTGEPFDPKAEDAATLRSLQAARKLERVAEHEVGKLAKSPHASPDDFRRASSTLIQARGNAERARRDRQTFLREAGEVLFLSEAQEAATAVHNAAAITIGNMSKQLAPRLVNQPQKAIERTLADFADRLLQTLRTSL
jgi:hypothetical protein